MQPYLTNHSIRATTVTVLSAANYESRHIKAITGHQSEASIESYSNTPTFHQFNAMSNAIIADFVNSGCSSADPSASLVAESTGMKAASSSIHSTSASPDVTKEQPASCLRLNSRRHISPLHFQLYRQSSRQQFPAKYLRIKLQFFFEYRVRSKTHVI